MLSLWQFAIPILTIWAVACFRLARSAEERAFGELPALGRSAIAATAFVGTSALVFRSTPSAAIACGLACIALVAAADSDARTGYLFDAVTLPAAILTTIVAVAGGKAFEATCGVAILVCCFGAVVICSKGRLMGLGDVKAMFALGAAFGPLESLIAIFAACVLGLAVACHSGGFRRGARLHFGPHLASGAAFALVAGDTIVHRIMGL